LSRPVLLLVNPAASGGKAVQTATRASAELQLAGVDHRIVHSRDIRHATDVAADAGARGELVAACGGDGFIGKVGGALRGTDGALGVIPGGRGNDFARVIGIPTDPRAAARVVAGGAERTIDVALCNGKPYLCIASCGFDSECNRLANETTFIRGNLVYLYSALRTLWEWRPATFRVSIDGARHELTGYSVAVGNSKAFGGGMYALPQAELDDGALDVMTIADMPKLGYAASLPKVFKGTHGEVDVVSFHRGARIEVSADRPFTMYADGDPIADLPCVLTVEPSSLRVVVPSGT
jgi:YegS/Rv2252/BmrU family lipid kinase